MVPQRRPGILPQIQNPYDNIIRKIELEVIFSRNKPYLHKQLCQQQRNSHGYGSL